MESPQTPSRVIILVIFLTFLCTLCSGATCSYGCTMEDPTLDCWRENIDVFSNIILDAINQRVIVANHIGEWKRKRNLAIFDPVRAGAVLDNIVGRNQGPLPNDAMRIIFDNIVNQTTIYETNFKGTPPRYSCPVPCLYGDMRSILVAVIAIQAIILMTLVAAIVFLVLHIKSGKITTENSLIK